MKVARTFTSSIAGLAIVAAGLLHLATQASVTKDPQSEEGASLTIYNQKFAVVRQVLPLELKPGANHVEVTDITGHLDPDSVILRPLDADRHLEVLEQNYRNDPVTQELLLSLYEGKTIDFQVPGGSLLQGKIIRSGFVPHSEMTYQTYGQDYRFAQQSYIQSGGSQPIIEVNGRLQFTLPGQPVFPALADDTVLKPTLSWQLNTNRPGAFPAEFSYVTEGMNWDASYNVVAPPTGDVLQLVGWVTLDNESGKSFKNARIKLMAGDVNKIQRAMPFAMGASQALMVEDKRDVAPPPVTERNFDEYHLYTLEHRTTLHDREIKQVEFVRAAGIQSKRIYVYDGFKLDPNYINWSPEALRQQESFGTQSNNKVWVMQEFKNTRDNNLGMPLPKGRVRFYRRDEDGQLEFTGENDIDHTPKDEMVRLYTGNAFDLTGERHRMDYHLDGSGRSVDETFEIKVRNHKAAPAEIRVVEHLFRWTNWNIVTSSAKFEKDDSQTVHFILQVPPDGERTVTYHVHYSW